MSAPTPPIMSDPDGYTLFASPPPPLVINQNLYAKLPFDPAQFIPLAVMGKVPNAILTNSPRLKDVKTVADFVAYAKAHPGELNSGTQGIGTTVASDLGAVRADGGRQVPAHPLSRLGAGGAGPRRRQRSTSPSTTSARPAR